MAEYVWGRQAVQEVLRSTRGVYKLLLSSEVRPGSPIDAIVQEAQTRHIPMERVNRQRLNSLSEGAVHQGVVALVAPRRFAQVEDMLALAKNQGVAPLLLALDAIQDVTNLGSLLRTAEAVGVHGVLLPEHRAAGLTAAVDKSSAGAVEHLLITQVTNLSRTLVELKQKGLWIVGLAGDARQHYTQADLLLPLTLVVGSEHKGISRLVREHCDLLISLPMYGKLNSLNAAVAGSIILYEVLRQRELPSSVHQ